MVPERYLTLSAVSMIKRPTFEGPALPKRPLNAYALFVMDNKNSARTEEGSRLDVKKLGEMWKELSEGERHAYSTRYAEEKRLYDERVEQFMRDLGGQKEQEAYRKSLAEYRAKRRAYLKQFRLKKLGLVKPRKLPGYQVFAGERLREAGGHGLNIPLIKEIPSLWKALSEDDRKGYEIRAKEIYETRVAEYNERLEKAKKDGIVPATEDKEKPKPIKTAKKKATSTKKTTSAKKRASAKKTNKTTAASSKKKSTKTSKSAAKTDSGKTERAAEDDKDEEWVHSDEED